MERGFQVSNAVMPNYRTDLESKNLLTLEEFKDLGHRRLRTLIRTEVVC